MTDVHPYNDGVTVNNNNIKSNNNVQYHNSNNVQLRRTVESDSNLDIYSISEQMGGIFCAPCAGGAQNAVPGSGATVHVMKKDFLRDFADPGDPAKKKRRPSEPESPVQDRRDSWNYDAEDPGRGPQSWPQGGTRQSPIDLRLSRCRVLALDNDPLRFAGYAEPLAGHFRNNGHTVQFVPNSPANAPEIFGGFLRQRYRFLQYHYHWSQCDTNGSEHSIGGLYYSAELHLVHEGVDDPRQLAVLAVFLTVMAPLDCADDGGEGDDAAATAREAEVDALRAVSAYGARQDAQIRLADRIPANTSFIRYEGSLTTPPCTENVTWTVFTDPLKIPYGQLAALRGTRDHGGRPIACNCRRPQSLNGRRTFLAL